MKESEPCRDCGLETGPPEHCEALEAKRVADVGWRPLDGEEYERALATLHLSNPAYVAPRGVRAYQSATAWLLPRRDLGSLGFIVHKASRSVTTVGSALELAQWLWGYDRGLLAPYPTLRIVKIHQLEAFGRFLQKVQPGEDHLALAKALPLQLKGGWPLIPALREAEAARAFDFECRP